MEDWASLKLSLFGKISAVKMSTLPKLNFLFQNLPILTSYKILDKIEKDIRDFIWEKRKPRIKYKLLFEDTERGGVALPSIHLYYKAAAMIWVDDWMRLEDARILELEGYDMEKGWHNILWSTTQMKQIPKMIKNHTIRGSLQKVWQDCNYLLYGKIPPWYRPLEAISRKTTKKMN